MIAAAGLGQPLAERFEDILKLVETLADEVPIGIPAAQGSHQIAHETADLCRARAGSS